MNSEEYTSISLETFQKLSTIIEQDQTDNTFKYALLRATSEICQDNTHLIKFDDKKATIPIGLLVEKWLFYYWPIFEYQPYIPQMPERYHGERRLRLQFRDQLHEVINYYKNGNGISEFYNDYLTNQIPSNLEKKLMSLFKKIRWLIQRYPMKHLGKSVYDNYYKVFKPNKPLPDPRKPISRDLLIEEFGTFSISLDYYRVFNVLGGYVIGDQSIITQWAKLTEKFTNQNPNFSEIQTLLMEYPVTERQVQKVRTYYETLLDVKGLNCTWSGKPIHFPSELHIDHMFPFAKYRNNDLWNLVPTLKHVNSRKGDRIPSPKLLTRRRTLIHEHWEKMKSKYTAQFESEIKMSLIGYEQEIHSLNEIFTAILEKSKYLINFRRYKHWDG